MVLVCQGRPQNPEDARTLVGAETHSVNWQSHPDVSWVFSLLKALGNCASNPLVSRLNFSGLLLPGQPFLVCVLLGAQCHLLHFLFVLLSWKICGIIQGVELGS